MLTYLREKQAGRGNNIVQNGFILAPDLHNAMQLIREVKTPPIPKRNHNVSKFTVLATVKFVAGAREQLLDMLSAHRTRCLAEEPGTLTFEILVPREQESTFFLYEEYTDEEAFKTHVNAASFTRLVKEAAEIITELKANLVTPLDPSPEADA